MSLLETEISDVADMHPLGQWPDKLMVIVSEVVGLWGAMELSLGGHA